MVGLWLLFSRAHLIHSSSLQSLTGFFLISQLLHISLVIILTECQPIHHIAGIMNLEEGLQFTINGILHSGGKFKVQWLARNWLQVFGNVVEMFRQQNRSLVKSQFLATGILSETAVISNERTHILRSRLHAEQDRTIHDCHILRHIDHRLDVSMHRHRNLNLVTLLPFALDADKSILLITIGIKTNTLHGEVITPRWFTNLQGEDTFSLSYFYMRCLSVWESGLLTNHHLPFLPIQLGSHEEIHVQCIILRLHTLIVRPDKLSILSMVFHTCSHAAPHCLIRGRIVAVMARTGGSEIDIAAMLRMLGREDMVEHRSLVKVAIHAIVLHSVQILSKLQHIIRIARLRSINVVDIVYASFLSREVLTPTVTAQSQRTLTCHNFPEILAGIVVLYIMSQLSDALIADNLRNLRIGMHIVKAVLAVFQRNKQLFVGEAAGTTQIFRIIGHGIGISKHLVHASMLVT